jgi:hypothetical protein
MTCNHVRPCPSFLATDSLTFQCFLKAAIAYPSVAPHNCGGSRKVAFQVCNPRRHNIGDVRQTSFRPVLLLLVNTMTVYGMFTVLQCSNAFHILSASFHPFPVFSTYRVLDLFMFQVPSVNFDGTPALISGQTRAWPQGPRRLLMVALGLLCSTSETEWLGSYRWDKLVNRC